MGIRIIKIPYYGGNIFSILSFLLVIHYFYLGINGSKRIVGMRGIGILLSFVWLGILFRWLFLPGGVALIYFGVPLLGIGILVLIILALRSGRFDSYKGIFIRVFITFVLGFLLYLTPMERQIDFIYRNYPDYAEAMKVQEQYYDSLELINKMYEELEKMKKKNRGDEEENKP